jgi:hypothetical protein
VRAAAERIIGEGRYVAIDEAVDTASGTAIDVCLSSLSSKR